MIRRLQIRLPLRLALAVLASMHGLGCARPQTVTSTPSWAAATNAIAAGDFATAIARLQDLRSTAPSNPKVLGALGRAIELSRQDPFAAIAWYEAAIAAELSADDRLGLEICLARLRGSLRVESQRLLLDARKHLRFLSMPIEDWRACNCCTAAAYPDIAPNAGPADNYVLCHSAWLVDEMVAARCADSAWKLATSMSDALGPAAPDDLARGLRAGRYQPQSARPQSLSESAASAIQSLTSGKRMSAGSARRALIAAWSEYATLDRRTADYTNCMALYYASTPSSTHERFSALVNAGRALAGGLNDTARLRSAGRVTLAAAHPYRRTWDILLWTAWGLAAAAPAFLFLVLGLQISRWGEEIIIAWYSLIAGALLLLAVACYAVCWGYLAFGIQVLGDRVCLAGFWISVLLILLASVLLHRSMEIGNELPGALSVSAIVAMIIAIVTVVNGPVSAIFVKGRAARMLLWALPPAIGLIGIIAWAVLRMRTTRRHTGEES